VFIPSQITSDNNKNKQFLSDKDPLNPQRERQKEEGGGGGRRRKKKKEEEEEEGRKATRIDVNVDV
jgi:hypothetical protein